MARQTRASQLRTIVELERSAHVLARMHDELRAAPDSTRTKWLLERNEKARARIAEKLEAAREKLLTQRSLASSKE